MGEDQLFLLERPFGFRSPQSVSNGLGERIRLRVFSSGQRQTKTPQERIVPSMSIITTMTELQSESQ
jgi:hypothetical protein